MVPKEKCFVAESGIITDDDIRLLKEQQVDAFLIGRALMEACIRCARDAGFVQLELSVVADNARAVAMYQRAGFAEYGRNPKGFRSRTAGFQEVVFMRLEL